MVVQSMAGLGMSFVYTVYKVGEIELPSSTPAVNGKDGPTKLPIFILACLFEKKLLINFVNTRGNCGAEILYWSPRSGGDSSLWPMFAHSYSGGKAREVS